MLMHSPGSVMQTSPGMLFLGFTKGPFIIYGGGWHRREMFFVAKILLTQPLKKSKI